MSMHAGAAYLGPYLQAVLAAVGAGGLPAAWHALPLQPFGAAKRKLDVVLGLARLARGVAAPAAAQAPPAALQGACLLLSRALLCSHGLLVSCETVLRACIRDLVLET